MKISTFLFALLMPTLTFASDNFDFRSYTDDSLEALRIQTEAHAETWGIGSAETWNVDQNTGVIWWEFADGKKAKAPVQIIGTYNPKNGSFMWGWEHPSIKPDLQAHAALVKDFGKKHGISRLTTKVVNVTEGEAWEFVAIASRLAEANGGYRADAGGPIVFMTFGTITLAQGQP